MVTARNIIKELYQIAFTASDQDVKIIEEALEHMSRKDYLEAANTLQCSEDCGTPWDEQLHDIISSIQQLHELNEAKKHFAHGGKRSGSGRKTGITKVKVCLTLSPEAIGVAKNSGKPMSTFVNDLLMQHEKTTSGL